MDLGKTRITPTTRGKTPSKSFLEIYLNFAYHCCVVPFRITLDKEGLSYSLMKSRLQQVICAFVTFSCIIFNCTQARQLELDKLFRNRVLYFRLVERILDVAFSGIFFHTVWTQGEKFRLIVDSLGSCPVLSSWQSPKLNFRVKLLCILYTIIPMINGIVGYPTIMSAWIRKDWSPMNLIRVYASEAKYTFFLTNLSSITDSQELSGDISTTEVFLGILTFLMTGLASLSVYYIDLLILLTCLTLWHATRSFTRSFMVLENRKNFTNRNQAAVMMKEYRVLKFLSGLLSVTMGHTLVAYTIESILYYALFLDKIFLQPEWYSKFILTMFLCSTVFSLRFAAGTCHEMDRFQIWLLEPENRGILPADDLSVALFLKELSFNPVAISGNGMFTINYTFIANVTATLVTYFIIIIQFDAV